MIQRERTDKHGLTAVLILAVKFIFFTVISIIMTDFTINIFAVYIEPSKAFFYAVGLFVFYFALMVRE